MVKGEGWGRKINTTDVAMYALHKIPLFKKKKKTLVPLDRHMMFYSAVPSNKQALPLRSSVSDPGKCTKSVAVCSSTELNVILIAFSFRSQSQHLDRFCNSDILNKLPHVLLFYSTVVNIPCQIKYPFQST